MSSIFKLLIAVTKKINLFIKENYVNVYLQSKCEGFCILATWYLYYVTIGQSVT